MQQGPVKLANNSTERERYENMADLYSIIKAAEHLERANMRDAISAEEYHEAITKLKKQYQTALMLNSETVTDVPKFMNDYKLSAQAGYKKLATQNKDEAKIIAETVQFYITAMDSLKLNMVAVDEIQPLITDVFVSLTNIGSLGPTFEGKIKMKAWSDQLSQMKASDELDDGQIRQLLFDLEKSYAAFHQWLSVRK